MKPSNIKKHAFLTSLVLGFVKATEVTNKNKEIEPTILWLKNELLYLCENIQEGLSHSPKAQQAAQRYYKSTGYVWRRYIHEAKLDYTSDDVNLSCALQFVEAIIRMDPCMKEYYEPIEDGLVLVHNTLSNPEFEDYDQCTKVVDAMIYYLFDE